MVRRFSNRRLSCVRPATWSFRQDCQRHGKFAKVFRETPLSLRTSFRTQGGGFFRTFQKQKPLTEPLKWSPSDILDTPRPKPPSPLASDGGRSDLGSEDTLGVNLDYKDSAMGAVIKEVRPTGGTEAAACGWEKAAVGKAGIEQLRCTSQSSIWMALNSDDHEIRRPNR